MSDYMIVNGELRRADNELKHYGVKGMKWGVRKNPAKAYSKASRKLNKLNRHVEKKERKMNKKIAKADKILTTPWLFSGGNKKRTRLHTEARTAVADYKKHVRKAKQWYDAMNDTFNNSSFSLSSEQIAMGKKYTEALVMDSLIRYN